MTMLEAMRMAMTEGVRIRCRRWETPGTQTTTGEPETMVWNPARHSFVYEQSQIRPTLFHPEVLFADWRIVNE